MRNRLIELLPSRFTFIVPGGLRLPPLLLEVKVYQGIDEELVDNEPERGTGKGGAKGPSYLAESGVLCRVVGHGEGRASGVSGKESKFGTEWPLSVRLMMEREAA